MESKAQFLTAEDMARLNVVLLSFIVSKIV